MARWGEGDPRWIVEERPDAKNVNNWHWTEKNASDWSKSKIKELLMGLEIKSDEGICKIVDVKKVEGEASANNRKAKLIFFYEFEIEAQWEGTLNGSEEKFEGVLDIPNLSDENSAEDLDVNVSTESKEDAAYKLKEIVRLKGTPLIREQLNTYIKQLKEEYGQNLILPTKNNSNSTSVEPKAHDRPKSDSVPKKIQKEIVLNANQIKNVQLGVPIATKNLSIKEKFKCTAQELYSAFVVPEMVQAFTRAPCNLEPHPGGKFKMFNGMIDGTFKELVPFDKILMTWRMKSYLDGHYSDVILRFIQNDDSTILHLDQSQIPESHYENTEDGWKRHYFEAIMQTFGFGAKLF